jgi:hypothetical protein
MSDMNPLTIVGVVLLVAGGIALVYGHTELLEAQQNSGFLGFGGGGGEAARQWQLVRLGGLVTGGVGAVLTFSGAVSD